MIDATLVVARDGAVWSEAHWIEATSLEDPLPRYRVVEIRDGSNDQRPLIYYVMPDRKP